MAMKAVTAIGIDLGTTNSCVGVVRNGRVEIIANDMGNRVTPSFVAFTDSERLVGDAAKDQAAWNPENTIFDVKRLIGRKFDNPHVKKMISHWPFNVQNKDESPIIKVDYLKTKKLLTPEEISSMVLIKMREVAETYLGCDVTDAVITVPAYFNDSQRQATIDAGKIAGLHVLSVVNEPTAAAIAYGIERKSDKKRNILVFDLGGGTFDVVVLKVEKDKFDVLAVNGDTFLGGGDLDIILMDHFINDFEKKYSIDIRSNQQSMGKLRKACEKAKRNLSATMKERIQIESLIKGIDYSSSISRVRFEELCSELFKKTLEPVDAVLKDANLSKTEIDEVVLAGGSTRIPKIQEMLKKYFGGKILNNTINPDEAVAYGAAYHAANLVGESTIQKISLSDVTPLTLGIEDVSGDFVRIINRNTKIPSKNTVKRTTVYDYQKTVQFKIYEGDHEIAKHNHFLGKFILEKIQIAPKRVPKFDCTFEIDRNGILHASAVDKSTGSNKAITVTTNKGRLEEKDISRMMVEALDFKENENLYREGLMARSDLESFCFDIKSKIKSNRRPQNYDSVDKVCDEVIFWIDQNETAGKDECLIKKKMLQKVSAELLMS